MLTRIKRQRRTQRQQHCWRRTAVWITTLVCSISSSHSSSSRLLISAFHLPFSPRRRPRTAHQQQQQQHHQQQKQQHRQFRPRRGDNKVLRRMMLMEDAASSITTTAAHLQAAADYIANTATTTATWEPSPLLAAASSSATTLVASALPFEWNLPFVDLGKQLYDNLDIGSSSGLLNNNGADKGPDFAANTELVVESIGHDVLVFLLASVVVTPVCSALNITPILGYLIIGAILGPHGGLDLFANSEGDVKLGDFGILFLLFSEGLEVSRSRLQKLLQYLPLGVAQISLVTLCLMAGILAFLDVGPIEAVVLALAATLSTSAFIFPVLKERGWEDEESGEAATSILLLQDLLVAPLLVSLPFLAGAAGTGGEVIDGVTQNNYAAIGFLTAKATIGFGSVIYVGSLLLRRVFALVAETGSAETFVALCLLVSAGMGEAAKMLGLTDTAGAFAAGLLLANTNYRAQIQADILPFKGILLGIFFMTAGSNFDVDLVIAEYPTIILGAVTLLTIKAVTLNLATRVPKWMEPNRLPSADALRVSLLLAVGGEFAFVVLALAEKLTIIPQDLASITTAIILITMGITPILGQIAETLSQPLVLKAEAEQEERTNAFTTTTIHTNTNTNNESNPNTVRAVIIDPETVMTSGTNNENVSAEQSSSSSSSAPLLVAHDSVVICGYGEVGQSLVKVLGTEQSQQLHSSSSNTNSVPNIVAFDLSPSLLTDNTAAARPNPHAVVLYGNGRNAAVIRSYGIETPSAVFVAYENFETVLDATTRLRMSFPVSVPIYTRASTNREAEELQQVGATHTVVESNELSRLASQLLSQNQQQPQQQLISDSTSSVLETELPMLESLVSATDEECVLSPTLDGCDDSSKERVRTAASIASGITSLSKIDQLLEIYKSFDVDGSGSIEVMEIERVLDRSGKWIANDDEIERVNTWIEHYVAETHPNKEAMTAIELCCLYAQAPDYVQRAFGLNQGSPSDKKKNEKKKPRRIPQV